MNIDIISLLMTTAFSLTCALMDLKDGIVRNAVFKYLGITLAMVNLMLVYLSVGPDWKRYGLFLAVGVIISLILFYTHIWAGADCKFYAIVVLLLPWPVVVGQVYGLSNIVVIVILAFLYGYMYILGESIWQYANNRKDLLVWQTVKSDFGHYFKTYFLIVLANEVINSLTSLFFQVTISNILLVVIDYALVVWANKWRLLENKMIVATIIIGNIAMQLSGLISILTLINLMIWAVVILALVLKNFARSFNYRQIDLGALEKGMILSTMSSIQLARKRYSRFKKISDESLNSRLDEQDILVLHQLASSLKTPQEVCIVKKIPFILFIYLGIASILIMGAL